MDKVRIYKDDLEIDHNNLDIEFIEQPTKFAYYAEQTANAKLVFEKSKERFEVAKAMAELRIRSELELENGKKPTESVVAAHLVLDDNFSKARQEHNDDAHTYNLISISVKAFEHRKVSLENLVKLLGMNYFSSPEAPRDIDHEFENRATRKKANANASSAKKKKAKRTK